MSGVNRRFLLRERPAGRIDDQTFGLVEEPVPVIGEGEALVRTRWISLDPANRAWLDDTPSYLPPVAIGDVSAPAASARSWRRTRRTTRSAGS